MSRRRSRCSVIREILTAAAQEDISKTKLIRKVNLNQKLANLYLESLTVQGDLECGLKDAGAKTYRVTARGMGTMRLLFQLEAEFPALFHMRTLHTFESTLVPHNKLPLDKPILLHRDVQVRAGH